jgi:PleD family two-component response regulator
LIELCWSVDGTKRPTASTVIHLLEGGSEVLSNDEIDSLPLSPGPESDLETVVGSEAVSEHTVGLSLPTVKTIDPIANQTEDDFSNQTMTAEIPVEDLPFMTTRQHLENYEIASLWTSSPRILLVDDCNVNRKLTEKLLNVLGCTVDAVEDGVGAISRIDKNDYDLILMARTCYVFI